MNRWSSIQALRGIAVLAVVVFHALSIERKYSGGDLLLPDFLRLGQSGVDLFFVISGFVMVTVTQGRFARRGETMRFLWGRLSRIYPTYWFYCFLTLAVFVLRPDWVNSSQGHQARFLDSFFLLPGNSLPLVMVAWSLTYELWFYLVFSVLLCFDGRFLLPSLLLWAAIIVAANQFLALAELPVGARLVLHPYALEFIIGALVALLHSRAPGPGMSARHAVLMVVPLLLVGLPLVHAFALLKEEGLLRMSLVGALYGLLVLAVATLEKRERFRPPRFLQFLGDVSYTVYLSHLLVLSAIGRLWLIASPAPHSLWDNLFACLAMLAAVVAYGWLGYRLLEQPLLQLSHRLRTRWFDTGRRRTPRPPVNTDAAQR